MRACSIASAKTCCTTDAPLPLVHRVTVDAFDFLIVLLARSLVVVNTATPLRSIRINGSGRRLLRVDVVEI